MPVGHLHAGEVSGVHTPDMTERIVVSNAGVDELEASRTF
jgi:hypothetical protein